MVREKHIYYGGVRECIGSRTSVLEQYQQSNRHTECRPFLRSRDQGVRDVDDNYFGESITVRPVVIDPNISRSARTGSALARRDS